MSCLPVLQVGRLHSFPRERERLWVPVTWWADDKCRCCQPCCCWCWSTCSFVNLELASNLSVGEDIHTTLICFGRVGMMAKYLCLHLQTLQAKPAISGLCIWICIKILHQWLDLVFRGAMYRRRGGLNARAAHKVQAPQGGQGAPQGQGAAPPIGAHQPPGGNMQPGPAAPAQNFPPTQAQVGPKPCSVWHDLTRLTSSLGLSHSSTLPNIRMAMSLVLQAYLSRGIRWKLVIFPVYLSKHSQTSEWNAHDQNQNELRGGSQSRDQQTYQQVSNIQFLPNIAWYLMTAGLSTAKPGDTAANLLIRSLSAEPRQF